VSKAAYFPRELFDLTRARERKRYEKEEEKSYIWKQCLTRIFR